MVLGAFGSLALQQNRQKVISLKELGLLWLRGVSGETFSLSKAPSQGGCSKVGVLLFSSVPAVGQKGTGSGCTREGSGGFGETKVSEKEW